MRLTPRGAQTRARILEATTALLREHGPAMTTIDHICLAGGTSKSQLYHHFRDKDAVIVAAVRAEAEALIASEELTLAAVTTIEHLQAWRDVIVADNAAAGGRFGCTLGSLTTQLSDQSAAVRAVLDESFATWGELLACGLLRIREAGGLAPEADVGALAIGIVAALQGGYVLARAARDCEPLAIALDMALDHVRSLAPQEEGAISFHGRNSPVTASSTGPSSSSSQPPESTEKAPAMTDSKQHAEDVAILERLNLDFNHSDQTNDVERFREILAEDFIMQLPGITRNRDEFLDFIAKPRPFKDLAVREATVRILGDVALIHARSTFTMLADGAEEESLYTDVYQKRDGVWLCVAACAIVPRA